MGLRTTYVDWWSKVFDTLPRRTPLFVLLALALVACGGQQPSSPAVLDVRITDDGVTLEVGATAALDWTVEVRGGADASVTWSSDDTSIATVDAGGVVTAVAIGTVTITVTSVADPEKTDSVTVTVTDAPSVARVIIDQSDQVLGIAEAFQFTATVQAVGGASASVSWQSDDEDVVAVDDRGVVTGISLGSAVVRATSDFDSDKNASVTVTVVAAKELWTVQFGGALDDVAFDAAVDDTGHVVVVGRSERVLDEGGAGDDVVSDAFVRKYDPQGAMLWEQRYASDASDVAWGVAVDSTGSVAVAGFTGLVQVGDAIVANEDGFLWLLDANGNEQWVAILDSGERDVAYSVTFDGEGDIIVAGATLGALGTGSQNAGQVDAFVQKYDAATGTLLWTQQFGTTEDEEAFDVVADADGNLAVVGYTAGNLEAGVVAGSVDAFVRMFDRDGTELWTRQSGTGRDGLLYRAAFDSNGNVIAVGAKGGADPTVAAARVTSSWREPPLVRPLVRPMANGDEPLQEPGLPLDRPQAFVWVLDASGAEVRRDLLDLGDGSIAYAVALDADQNAVVSGIIASSAQDGAIAVRDTFVRKAAASGAELWLRRIDASAADDALGVAVDSTGNVYVAGRTLGDLARTNAGGFDAFVRKYSP